MKRANDVFAIAALSIVHFSSLIIYFIIIGRFLTLFLLHKLTLG